jgi:flavin-dependent dehydrogenase
LLTSSTDVLIVGGGPAGCTAAIGCAEAGLRVTLIEREQFPRERPGETLYPGVEPLLQQLGVAEQVAAGFLRHMGHWVQWEGERRFVPFGADDTGPWRGFQAWRADFDAILLHRAREVGVTVRQPCPALRPMVKANRVVGVATAQGPLLAPFVVDAAGSRHWLARQLRLKIERYSPCLIARYGYVEGECPTRDEAPALVADPTGWTWTAKVRPRLYHWTRLSFGNHKTDTGWLPEEFAGLNLKGKIHGAEVTWRVAMSPAGPGYFVVGDAAAVLDPASSHGVLKAIMSGMLAAHLITRIACHALNEHQAAQTYCQWVYKWFVRDVRKLRELYALLPKPVDEVP